MSKTLTECEKMLAVKDKALLLTEFMDWFGEEGFLLCEMDCGWDPIKETDESLLARFFNIDLDKLEQEKQQFLEDLKQHNRE